MNSREHQGNEHTFLAWIRTSIALMGFGFVIVKFVLFLKQLSQMFQNAQSQTEGTPSGFFGIVMVALGILLAVIAYVNYFQAQRQIAKDTFKPAVRLPVFLLSIIVIGGFLLITYLFQSL